MSNTKPDKTLNYESWMDIISLFDIQGKSRFTIINKSNWVIIVQVTSSEPSQNNRDGIPVLPYKSLLIKDGFTGVYAISVGGKGEITAQDGDVYGHVPDGALTGGRAVNVQFYSESNIKKGLQFYIRKSFPLVDAVRGLGPLASGESAYILFKTGSKKVIFKSRIVSYIGEEFSLEIFSNPIVLAGNEGDQVAPSNFNTVNPQQTTVQVFKNVDLTGGSEGSAIDDEPEYYFGGTATGQRVGNSIPEGSERILNKDVVFLIKITNTGGGTGRFSYFGEWFEGEPDLPIQ